jgi:superfamily II RNA helicase
MGLDQTSSVVARKELYATLVEEVQDLEQNGHSLFLQLTDDRQMLIFTECKYGSCSVDIRVDLGIKGEDRLIVCRMVA